MKVVKEMGRDTDLVSIIGALRRISLPASIGFDSPKEVGKAFIAWRFRLTHEEVETLDLLAKGLRNDKIAEAVNVSEIKSVKNRVQAILDKLKVENRTKAAVIAAR